MISSSVHPHVVMWLMGPRPAGPTRPLRACRNPYPRALASVDEANSEAPYTGKKAVVIGAGPAGSTAAMFLAKQGFRVEVGGEGTGEGAGGGGKGRGRAGGGQEVGGEGRRMG